MINQIGTKVYYCLLTGNVIKIIGDMQGFVNETTFDEDVEIYTELKERDRDSIGLLQFKYGEYPKLSQGATGVMVNLETKELIFSYEELPQEPQEPTEIEVMQGKISILEEENKKINEEVILSMLAIADMYELNKLSSTSISKVNSIKVPTYIQSTYQKLYKLGLKTLNEIPFEVRINLKA